MKFNLLKVLIVKVQLNTLYIDTFSAKFHTKRLYKDQILVRT